MLPFNRISSSTAIQLRTLLLLGSSGQNQDANDLESNDEEDGPQEIERQVLLSKSIRNTIILTIYKNKIVLKLVYCAGLLSWTCWMDG